MEAQLCATEVTKIFNCTCKYSEGAHVYRFSVSFPFLKDDILVTIPKQFLKTEYLIGYVACKLDKMIFNEGVYNYE